ncbi:hypothetical protein PHMEG_000491 [Phytophthora megakarya]|uniref:Uncharacterized protein n=1 Tax=Phytophthora megakarya TaxID=4795 RepID=A0A225X5E8_9STRA|nr:hypothetical protein PHMEG_000491 [Phytophthora megakarya]
MSKSSSRHSRRDVTLQYEEAYPWEHEHGSTIDRTVDVNAEARRVYAMQEKLLPALACDRPLDYAASEHLQNVGRHVLLLRDTTKRARNQTGAQSPKQPSKRVIPSRFPEVALDLDEEDAGEPDRVEVEEDPVMTEGRIATMLMDHEWDTRGWNTTKIRSAVETLYEEIEHCEDDSRRELAMTMLLRLMETHEGAVDYVQISLPSLTNKAFRTLSKFTDNIKIFRMTRLVAVLAEWFAHVLSNENAVNKSIVCLLRETEVCARILQHHWRGVLFERTLIQRDYDPIVRTRLRSIHMIKFVELRHQFKVLREAIGPGGIPSSVTQAYITILYHVVKLHGGIEPMPDNTRNTVLANQRRILGSGLLVCLASLVTRRQSRKVIELVKGIVSSIIEGHGDEQIVEILKCNVVQRVQLELMHTMATCADNSVAVTTAAISSSLNLLHAIATKVFQATQRWGQPGIFSSTPASPTRKRGLSSVTDHVYNATQEERNFLMRQLTVSARQFLLPAEVFDTLFEVLRFCQDQDDTMRAQVLEILCLLARSIGFSQLLDALTRCGGQWLEHVLVCMKDDSLIVVQASVTLFYEITCRADARHGLTTAGAVQIFMHWCQPNFEACDSHMTFVTGLIGCALLARQTEQVKPATTLLAALTTFENRLDSLYTLLLDLAMQDETSPRASEKTADYFFSVDALSTVVKFLTQVSPSCMESSVQNSRQRNISCILLGRLCKVTHVMRACFSEDVVNHLALSIQCNRLDEIEGLVARSSSEDRLVHELGSKEACKALSRLARCPSNIVDARLRTSITSAQVPEWPQALICDVMFRMHVLEDLTALIRTPSDAAAFAEVELDKVIAAVELTGYIRPLPYGESTRNKFLQSHKNHPHGIYAQEKLLKLVELVAPAILHVLREKNADFALVSGCCIALSRLACTNAACSVLLAQGSLQTALIHLPEILIVTGASQPSPKRPQSVEFDSCVDDHGLLDVPAALYTFFGKLCAVADGRTGLMRAQVLPRLLKRMQMRHPTSRTLDDECKSEIAVIISRLAMVNEVEGSTGELFLHFKVLELLAKVLYQQRDVVLTQGSAPSSSKKKDEIKRWRLLVHAVGAIAALSQDVLVCVPRVVALDIVKLIFPFLARLQLEGSLNFHLESLQYDAMTIVRSIASYPFGEFHAYLTNAKVKQIGFDFAMELKNKPMALRDKKSVGELARETMAFINEQQQRLERQQEQRRQSNVYSGVDTTTIESRSSTSPSILVLEGSKSPVSLNGINIASTRPAGNNKPGPTSESPQHHHHYVFTRPKSKTKRRNKDSAFCLMLDPLFDSTCVSVKSRKLPMEKMSDEKQHVALEHDYQFSQEVDRFGHYVNVQAHRSNRGDRYFPSLGRIVTSVPISPDAYKRPAGLPTTKTQ